MPVWPDITVGTNETLAEYPAAFFAAAAERFPVTSWLNEDQEIADFVGDLYKYTNWDYTDVYPLLPMTAGVTVTSGAVLSHADEEVAVGDGGKTYTFTFPHDPAHAGNDRVHPDTVTIQVTVGITTYTVTDDGAGGLSGDGATGAIQYAFLAPECVPYHATPWLAHPYSGAQATVTFPVDVPVATSITASWEEDRTVLLLAGDLAADTWAGHELTTYDNADDPIDTYEIDSAEAGGTEIVLVGQADIVARRFSIDPAGTALDHGFYERLQTAIQNLVPYFVNHTDDDFTGATDVPMFSLSTFATVAGMKYDAGPPPTIFLRVQASGHTMTATYDVVSDKTTIHDSGAGFFRAGMDAHAIHVYGVGQLEIYDVLDANHVRVEGDHSWTPALVVAVLPIDWTDKDDVAFTPGLCASGDVRGGWLYYWAKKALQNLKWTVLWTFDNGVTGKDDWIHWDLAGGTADTLHWKFEASWWSGLEYDIDFYIAKDDEGTAVTLERWDAECLVDQVATEGNTGVQADGDYIGANRKRRAVVKWNFAYE